MRNKAELHKVKQLIHKIGLNNNLTDKQIEEIIDSQYEFIKEKIIEININDVEIKSNFLLKYLGKLYIDRDKLKNKIESYERRHASKHES